MKSINEIEELIAKDDFLNAIEAAIALAESYKLYDLVKSLLKLRSRLIANHEDKKLGEKTSSEFHLEKSRITRSLLDVLDNIEEENHGFDFQRGRDIVVGSANTSTSKPGIKDVILLAKEKLNIFYKELIIASDTAIRFTLKQQIKEQKEFIEGLKEESKPYNPVGNIVCELPREMMLHNPQLVTVKIFKKDEKSKEAKKGMNAKHLVVDKLKMSEVMVVRILEADSEENIRIVPLSNIEQVIDYDDINVWKFNLIPKRVGVFTIVIRVSQKVQLPKFNTEKENDVISWVENVSIKVDQLSIKSEAVLLDVGEWNQDRTGSSRVRCHSREPGRACCANL